MMLINWNWQNLCTHFTTENYQKHIMNFFKRFSSVHSNQTRFAKMENYFIRRVFSNAGKRSMSCRGASFWTKSKDCTLKQFLQSVTRVRILSVLHEQNKISCLLFSIKFHQVLLQFVVFYFLQFFLFWNVRAG